MMLVISLVIAAVTLSSSAQRLIDMERSCGQHKIVFDFDLTITGKATFGSQTIPNECVVSLEAGYTDSDYRLEIIIEALDIKSCAINLDIFNSRVPGGNYLRRLGCTSMSTDTIYTENQWASIRLSRPYNVALDAYIFTFKIRAYRNSDRALAGAQLSDGAIAGIILAILSIFAVAILLAWCWKSGRLFDSSGERADEEFDDLKKDPGNNLQSSSVGSLGVDNKNSSVWNTNTSGGYNNGTGKSEVPQFLGRRSFRNPNSNLGDNGVRVVSSQGQPYLNSRNPNQNSNRYQNARMQPNPGGKETLIDDVFESDDGIANRKSELVDDAYEAVATPHYLKKNQGDPFRENDLQRKEIIPNEAYENTNIPSSSGVDAEHFNRGENGRDSNRSNISNKEEKVRAKSLAEEAASRRFKSKESSNNQVEPPSDMDSSSFMSIPEPATITASVHQANTPSIGTGEQNDEVKNKDYQPNTEDNGNDNSSEDPELKEIHARAHAGDQDHILNPNIPQNDSKDKSPSNHKKIKKNLKENKPPKDVMPPEAFEPLFERPVSEEPYPAGLQPLNSGYNPYGGLHPMAGFQMPYGVFPNPDGAQTYSYAYQAPGGPGMTTQQVAGQAAYFVQETPTRAGPVQKTAFMMATQESRPDSNEGRPSSRPSSRQGSGRKKSKSKNKNIVPSGITPMDNGKGTSSAMMTSDVDPATGIKTQQVLWTNDSRDRTDPQPGANPDINRKTVTRTTTRGGQGQLPRTDNITDHLFLDTFEPAFLSPTPGGPHALSSMVTPERNNVSYYIGLNNQQTSPHRAIASGPPGDIKQSISHA